MTTWTALQLLPGAFAVPVPTVLLAPWQLEARIAVARMNLAGGINEDGAGQAIDAAPALAGFTRVTAADQWSTVEAAYPLTVYRHNNHGLHVAIQPRQIWSLIPIGWSNTTWDEAATRAGRVMVATADLPSYWHTVGQGRFPTFQDTFGDGCWAALAPFDTGSEAEIRKWPGAQQLGP